MATRKCKRCWQTEEVEQGTDVFYVCQRCRAMKHDKKRDKWF